MTEPALKPCPFCGCDNIRKKCVTGRPAGREWSISFYCANCFSTTAGYGEDEIAKLHWNRRYMPESTARLLVTAEELLEYKTPIFRARPIGEKGSIKRIEQKREIDAEDEYLAAVKAVKEFHK